MASGHGWRSFTPRSSGSTRSRGGCSAVSTHWRKPPATTRSIAARHDPVAYAALLLDFARHPNSRSVAMSVAESNVPERIERLLARTPPAAALTRVAGWALSLLLIPVVVFAASTTQAAPPDEAGAAAAASPVRRRRIAQSGQAVKLRMCLRSGRLYPAVAKQRERVQGYAIVEVDVDGSGNWWMPGW